MTQWCDVFVRHLVTHGEVETLEALPEPVAIDIHDDVVLLHDELVPVDVLVDLIYLE